MIRTDEYLEMYEWTFPKQQKESPESFPERNRSRSKKIEVKLHRLVDEFGVQPSEAERSVTNELAKEFNLPAMGTTGARSSSAANIKRLLMLLPVNG